MRRMHSGCVWLARGDQSARWCEFCSRRQERCVRRLSVHPCLDLNGCRCGSRRRGPSTNRILRLEWSAPLLHFILHVRDAMQESEPMPRDSRDLGSGSSQVVSFGPLGILGRNGWFCREDDVERWNSVAGWRGLRDPAVQRYFNSTLLAFTMEWGDQQRVVSNLGLAYNVAYLGTEGALNLIRARLADSLPVLFYLWSPHPFNAQFNISRVQLPAYRQVLYEQGLSDFPIDVLEKVASRQLAVVAPVVAEFYSNFQIDNSAQESMLAMTDAGSVMQAACSWMRREESSTVWPAWLPAKKLTCSAGNYAADNTSCVPCPPGSGSAGGAGATCVQCSAGVSPLLTLVALSLETST